LRRLIQNNKDVSRIGISILIFSRHICS